jgi:hypothetical protein
MKLAYNLKSNDGEAIANTIHHTVHKLGPALK